MGSAWRLVKAALQEAAKKREKRYSDLKKIVRGVRRNFHDDITVIVAFLDSNLVSRASFVRGPTLSLRGCTAKNFSPLHNYYGTQYYYMNLRRTTSVLSFIILLGLIFLP